MSIFLSGIGGWCFIDELLLISHSIDEYELLDGYCQKSEVPSKPAKFNCLVGLNEKQIYLFCNYYLFQEVMGIQNLKVNVK